MSKGAVMRLGSLISLFLVGENISKARLYQLVLHRMAVIIALAAITGILVATCFVTLLYLGWTALLYNFDVLTATLIIACATIVVTAGAVAYTANEVGKMKNIAASFIKVEAPVKTKLQDVASSFLAGLMDGDERPQRKSPAYQNGNHANYGP